MLNCLLPSQAEKLKKAFRNGEITMSSLFKMTSEKRAELFAKYVGESAKEITAKIEKAFMKPRQKQAITNVFYKEIAQQSPLYQGVSFKDAGELAKIIEPRDLRKMSAEQVNGFLKKVLDEKLANTLTTRFENLKKSGNLKNWEERVIGTKKLRGDKQLLKGLSKIDALDDLGVLNPEQLQDFMSTLVENELGVDITMEQSKKLSKLNDEVKTSYETIAKTNDWTWENKENVEKFFDQLDQLNTYADSLQTKTAVKFLNKAVNYFRASILATPKTALNSAFYQVIPSVERAITKRLVSGQFVGNKKWAKEQLKMAIKIYNKTGYDVSRMQSLGDGAKIFGGERFERTPRGKGIGNAYMRLVEMGPKWGAGGTDMLLANSGRASTSWLLAKAKAKKEFEAGKIDNVSVRAKELVKDSYSFAPKTEEGQFIRESAILDANVVNNTQNLETADRLLGIRKIFTIKGIKFGTVLIPFAKISLTNFMRGLKIATGGEVVENIMLIKKATKMEGVEREQAMYKATTGLVAAIGLTGAAILLASGLDNDDYVGTYKTLSSKEDNIAKARNAPAGSVKLFGKWVPIRYLPLVNIPLSAIMTARQAKEKGGDYIGGYLAGLFGGIVEAPIISQMYDLIDKSFKAAKTKTLKGLSPDKKDISDWIIPRAIPAIISRPLLSHFKTQKYDFMGREVAGGFMFKDDTSNDVVLEFDNLNKTGHAPVISDPTGTSAGELETKMGEEAYTTYVNTLKNNYTLKVIDLMDKESYQSKTNEEKMKLINKLRTRYILDKIKKKNKLVK